MAIIYLIDMDSAGQAGVDRRRVKMIVGDSLATVTAAGYLNPISLQGYVFLPSDIVDIWYSSTSQSSLGTHVELGVSISNGVITLAALPSDIAPPLIVAGNIQAGSSGTAGTLSSFPAVASKGSFVFAATANTGNTVTTFTNAAMGQTTNITIPDPGAPSANVVLSAGPVVMAVGSTITYRVTLGFAALATAGKVVVQAHTSATSKFAVVDMKLTKATGLSGGGGDRLLTLGDGTLVFNNAGITAALLGTPVPTIWGGTGNPLPAATVDFTASTAGADIYFQYAGGTTDYTAGSTVVSVTLAMIAA